MTAPRKFRVWDGELEEMYRPPHHYVLDCNGGVIPPAQATPKDAVVPLFYTGLDDAEGTPIYEGDFQRGPSGRLFVVDWSTLGGEALSAVA